MIKHEIRIKILKALKETPELFSIREKEILKMRHEPMKEHPFGMTLQDVGSNFGVTRERIRQIEANCISRLK